MFSIDNLTVQVNDKNLIHNISLTVPKGEITAVIGESGSGKSTTISAILGMLPPQTEAMGAVFFNGENMLTMSKKDRLLLRSKHIFTIFQDATNSFSPTQKMKQQLYMFTALRVGDDKERFLSKMTAILKELNLSVDILESYPFELSGGMLQRCMLACALYNEPDILIADEPTSALDMLHQQHFITLLKKLHAQLGTTIILVTHDLGVAVSLANNIVVMKDGEIVEKGQATEIFEQPKHPYTLRLVANHF
ncbi:ATP-binding cassette domain-containing protein [Lysinibacillus sp. JNUCC-52]|uniref:ATP-binding cassette domain-containing protein n=1 Tax=Lysinibacillus sp. JNUCC-52 TaxID=2792480 RepID=UPI001935A381|nr:ABC transporter ATP-binding protein [Lysinibacillus sp. JNUCC-52]